MIRGAGDRGLSEVVGFILIFGMLVTAFTVYQGIVVPDQNRQAEFEHNQDVQGDLQDLRNAIVTTAATGSGEAVSITPGATYPRRTIASNLGASSGALSTRGVDSAGIRIDNVRAQNPETRDYIDSSANGPLGPFGTKAVHYTPVYSFYSNAPETVYENTIAYNRFDDANLTLTDQVMIDDRRITLIAVNGSLSRAQRETTSISTTALSTSSTRVAVVNTTGDRVNVTVPTTLTASTWAEILSDEMGSDGYVHDVSDVDGASAVNITLDRGHTYELRLAKVGLGEVTSEEDAAYVTDVEGDDVSLPEDGTQKLVVEVRDELNNPVSNVTVTAAAPATGSVSPSSATTGTDGRATFVYAAPSDVDGTRDVDVTVSFDDGGDPTEVVTFDVRVLDTDGSGAGGGDDDGGDVEEVNPGASGTIILDSQSTISGGGDESVTLTFKNTTDQSMSITDARVSFYFNGDPGGGDTDPTQVEIYSDAQGVPSGQSTTLDIGDDFVSLSSQIPLNPTPSDSSDTTVVDLDFDEEIENDDFYVISLKFSNGDTYTYFVSHP